MLDLNEALAYLKRELAEVNRAIEVVEVISAGPNWRREPKTAPVDTGNVADLAEGKLDVAFAWIH